MVHDPNRNNRTARGDSSLRGSTFFPFTFETLRPSGIVTNPTLGERAPLLCTKSTERTASILAPCLSHDFPPFTHLFYTPASRRKHFAIFHQQFLHEERRNLGKLPTKDDDQLCSYNGRIISSTKRVSEKFTCVFTCVYVHCKKMV